MAKDKSNKKGNKKINRMTLGEVRQKIKELAATQPNSHYYEHLLDHEQALTSGK